MDWKKMVVIFQLVQQMNFKLIISFHRQMHYMLINYEQWLVMVCHDLNILVCYLIFYRLKFVFVFLDVLINNCGIQHVSPIENFPDSKWEDILRINLTSAFILTKALIKPMKENKFGRIINIASAHGLFASEYKSAYVAAKHGVLGLTKVTALEGAPFNINCNAICPGYVRTPLVELQIRDQAKSHDISGILFSKNILQK